MSIMNLQPGAMVMALKDLDPEGANVKKGDMGVVFAGAIRADIHLGGESGWDTGPCVRWTRKAVKGDSSYQWFEVEMGGVCNVYDGDVHEAKSE